MTVAIRHALVVASTQDPGYNALLISGNHWLLTNRNAISQYLPMLPNTSVSRDGFVVVQWIPEEEGEEEEGLLACSTHWVSGHWQDPMEKQRSPQSCSSLCLLRPIQQTAHQQFNYSDGNHRVLRPQETLDAKLLLHSTDSVLAMRI